MQCNEFEIVEMRVFPFFEPKVLHGTKIQTTCTSTQARDVCWTNGRETRVRVGDMKYEGTTAACCVL